MRVPGIVWHRKSGDTAMMLNQLILARGYVLAPMLPSAETSGESTTKTSKSVRAMIVDVLKRFSPVRQR
jgi:hypothetical protein